MGKNYKYDVISSKKVETADRPIYPQYLLGDSAKEAEDTLKEYEKYLNNIASAYASLVPTIDKGDFFIEGIEALAKAKRDYDSTKGCDFKPYAKFIIIDAMNEFIRKNKAIVQIPSYISKSNKIIYKIKQILGENEIDWFNILFEHTDELSDDIKEPLMHYKNMLENAAERASISCRQLADRAEFLPNTTLDVDTVGLELTTEIDHDKMMARLVVDKIMPLLDDTEKLIAEMIMLDMNKREIAGVIERSDMYVADRIKSIKQKVLKMMTGE